MRTCCFLVHKTYFLRANGLFQTGHNNATLHPTRSFAPRIDLPFVLHPANTGSNLGSIKNQFSKTFLVKANGNRSQKLNIRQKIFWDAKKFQIYFLSPQDNGIFLWVSKTYNSSNSDDELDIRIRLAGRTGRSVMGSNLAPV